MFKIVLCIIYMIKHQIFFFTWFCNFTAGKKFNDYLLFLKTPVLINPLTPNDPYIGRTAPLTSKRCILYIYSTNIGTEYFKHGIYSDFFLFKMQFV